MNWTEGNLNRHSRGRKGKETFLRQKEHFAKVRAGLLDANVKISPPSLSFLALPAQPHAVRRDSPESTVWRNHPSGDRLMSSRYFSEPNLKFPTSTAFLGGQTEEEAMRQKRRKLLLKGDWVGTNVQKPIDMEFTKPRGSPSTPWGARKTRRHASKDKLRQLVGLAHGGGRNRVRRSPVNLSAPTSLRRMKIRVGSYERALGDRSNTSSRVSGCQDIRSGSRGKAHQSRDLGCSGHRQGRDYVSISTSDASRRSHSSASQTPLLATSPLLFHPVPTRPALLQLLHPQMVDSDNAASTLAQLGIEHPPISSSQAEENDAWRTFVAGPDNSSALTKTGTSDNLEAAQRLISPGMSQFVTSEQSDDTYEVDASVQQTTREIKYVGKDNDPADLFAEVVRTDPSHQGSSETLSDDDQIAVNGGDYSPSRVGFDFSRPSESAKTDDRGSSKEQAATVKSSDEVSLLMVSSPGSFPSSLEMTVEAIPVQTDQPKEIITRTDSLSPQTAVLHLDGKDPDSLDESSAAVRKQLPSECTPENENDMWRKFVFGELSENLDKALEDARKDTARGVRPSLTSTSTCSCDESQQAFMTSSLGQDSIERCDFAEALCCPGGDVPTTSSPSHVATARASSAELSSESGSGSLETAIRTDQATHGSPSSSSRNGNGNNTSRLLFRKDLVSSSICETENGSLTIDPQQLEKHGESDDCFKFARPKLFVGKKIGHIDEQQQIALSAPQIRGRTQTRRRQRRTTDGRADIRKLPNYGSDPIEEFEGDTWSNRAEKGSIFGPLETEDGF